MAKTTRRKMKIVGKQAYIDQETGEMNEVQVIDIEKRDANFHKIWLSHILNSSGFLFPFFPEYRDFIVFPNFSN